MKERNDRYGGIIMRAKVAHAMNETVTDLCDGLLADPLTFYKTPKYARSVVEEAERCKNSDLQTKRYSIPADIVYTVRICKIEHVFYCHSQI